MVGISGSSMGVNKGHPLGRYKESGNAELKLRMTSGSGGNQWKPQGLIIKFPVLEILRFSVRIRILDPAISCLFFNPLTHMASK